MDVDQIIEDYRNKGLAENDLTEIEIISNGDASLFRRLAQRRLFHEPMAYLKGSADFYGREFNVDSRVYIPTAETECMVKLLLDDITPESIVVDVGTGSGSIAITVAKELPGVNVYACDITPYSLEVAEENARRHNADVEFFESYYVDDLDIPAPTHIIADLPWGDETYVLGSNDIHEMKHLPAQSCFHPFGVLEAYSELINSIQGKKWKPKLFFESGRVEKDNVKSILPSGVGFRYFKFDEYSVSVVRF